MLESIAAFWAEYGTVLTDGIWDTLVMVVISTVFAYLIGLPLGVALILTKPHGIRPHRGIYRVLDWIVNIGRSIPFIILMVAIMPFTRMVVGTTIGVRGAIVPLVVSAAPFIARMVETSLSEVDAGVVEAAQSMGASTFQIVWKVYLPEAKPSLILGGAISLVTILAYTAIAGMVGAPLVLHGGSGLSDEDFRMTIQKGIAKVNIFTDINCAAANAAHDCWAEGKGLTDLMPEISNAVKQATMKKMKVFGSAGQA